jgi:hypothetical protein
MSALHRIYRQFIWHSPTAPLLHHSRHSAYLQRRFVRFSVKTRDRLYPIEPRCSIEFRKHCRRTEFKSLLFLFSIQAIDGSFPVAICNSAASRTREIIAKNSGFVNFWSCPCLRFFQSKSSQQAFSICYRNCTRNQSAGMRAKM